MKHGFTAERFSQETVETVDFIQRTCSEEDEDCSDGRKADSQRFLRLTRCDLHRLLGEGQNGHRTLQYWIIGIHVATKRMSPSLKLNIFPKSCTYERSVCWIQFEFKNLFAYKLYIAGGIVWFRLGKIIDKNHLIFI